MSLGAQLVFGSGSDASRAQCNRLIQTANAQESALSARTNNAAIGNDPSQLDALAAAFETAGRALSAVMISDPTLLDAVDQYVAVIMRFVTVAREMARAMRVRDIARTQALIPRLTAIERESEAAVTAINQYCQSF